MVNKRQQFINWLEADTSRKANLPKWEEFLNIVTSADVFSDIDFFFYEAASYVWNTDDTSENVEKYFEIYGKWVREETGKNIYSSFQSPRPLLGQKKEFKRLKSEKTDLETKLQDQEKNLNNFCRQLDQLKSELSKKAQEYEELKIQLEQKQTNHQELEQQLTTLAVSSGLLTQQVENLTNQLTESQQHEERVRLEREIKANLIREQGDKITQQEQQITSYQKLLRTSEENLSNCQKIISQKSEQLEQLAKEKEDISQELESANSKIKELEQALLTSGTKILELGKKPVKVQGTTETSFWQTIKTPLYYGLGIILVIIALGWIISAIKDK